MVALEVSTLSRQTLNDLYAQRWSEPTILNFIDRASKKLMRDVLFPDARITTVSIANQQEYQLPYGVMRLDSVYLNGQLCSPTDRSTLEGHQIGLYDQGQFGGNQYTQVQPGSGGPPGTNSAYAPKWVVQPPTAFPVMNWWGWPRPDAQSWGYSQAPRYYRRGGWIGFVPAPANPPNVVNGVVIPNICIDCCMLPDTVVQDNQLLWYPDHFCECLSWKVVEFAKFGDSNQQASDDRNYAMSQYTACMRDLRMWVATEDGDAPEGPKVECARNFYLAGFDGGQVERAAGPGYP
jgi:hypothetical protein